MQITAPPIPFHRAASNRPPELSQTAAVRLRLLEQWRAIRAEGATAARAAGHPPRPPRQPLPLAGEAARARTARPRTRLPPPVSASMAGRILSDAKRRGILREPLRPGVRRRNPKPKRPYAVRNPKDYRPTRQATSSKSTPSTSARSPA